MNKNNNNSCRVEKFRRAFPLGKIVTAVIAVLIIATIYLAGCTVKKVQTATEGYLPPVEQVEDISE